LLSLFEMLFLILADHVIVQAPVQRLQAY